MALKVAEIVEIPSKHDSQLVHHQAAQNRRIKNETFNWSLPNFMEAVTVAVQPNLYMRTSEGIN